jgi:hypothetical protein
MTSPTTQDLIERITQVTDALMHSEWKASIPFLCVPFMNHMAGIPLPVPAVHDICAYLGGRSSNQLVTRLYLKPPIYNSLPTGAEKINKSVHYNLLGNDIITKAFEAGSLLFANGGGKTERIFRCTLLNRIYKKRGTSEPSAYCEDSLINNRSQGSRENGRPLIRRTRTTQALCHDDICPFCFVVKWDEQGFYIPVARCNGCPNHRNHISEGLNKCTIPLKLVPQEEKDNLRDMFDASFGKAVGINFAYSKLGRFITKSQIAYLNSPENPDLLDGLRNSDADILISFFEQAKDVSYHVLWDVPFPASATSSTRTHMPSYHRFTMPVWLIIKKLPIPRIPTLNQKGRWQI